MARRTFRLIPVATLALFAGCIVSDQITTLIIRPDGSAELTRLQSNIRSSEAGAKGAEELKRFVEEFDARKDDDQKRIAEAGGTVLESRWLRREEPYANLLVARLPSASALMAFCTQKNDKGEAVLQTRFTENGKRRRLSVAISLPKEEKPGEPAKSTVRELREEQANGISETRIVVAGGQIVDSRGFTVAADKRSALLEPAQIRELIQAAREKAEIFLEWEVGGK